MIVYGFLGRNPSGSILVRDHPHPPLPPRKRPLSLHILGGRLREIRLYNTTVRIIAKLRHFFPTSRTSLCIAGALYISPWYLTYGVRCAWCEAATTHLTIQLKTTSTSFISLQRKTLYKPANQCVSGSSVTSVLVSVKISIKLHVFVNLKSIILIITIKQFSFVCPVEIALIS